MGDLQPVGGGGILGPHLKTGGSLGLPFSQQILLIEIVVAGTTHIENLDEIESELTVGSRLSLFREPQNAVDPLAIVVKDVKSRKLGYVPREKNEILARLLDAGKRVYAVVREKKRVGKWLKIEAQIFLDD